ncbi:MAG: SpoIIE family protein phosphatase, partial [Alphaproteobacteria bacterium]|nr:SpoIIE family protein phosphatase [Alphaproteobacteria bacterium]
SMTPAKEIGGDFYDYFDLESGKVGFAVADVSGKGMGAALFMAISRTLLRANAMAGLSPGACLTRVNKLLCVDNESMMFVTLFYAILDTATGEIVYANGGHNAPYRIDHAEQGEKPSPIERTDGIALGIDETASYAEATLTLDPGDSLFLYTDGITEAFDTDGQQFGETRMAELLTGSRALDPRAMLETATEAVSDFTGDAEQTDDVTCLVLKVTAHQAAKATPRLAAADETPGTADSGTKSLFDGNLSITFRNDHSEVHRLAALVEDLGASAGLSPKLVHDLNLALDELLTNTIGYGYEDDEEHQITVRVSVGPDVVTAEIEDDAKPFNPLTAPPPDLGATLAERQVGGLGIHIVKSLMDRMEYRREGERNHLIIEKARSE